MKVAVQATSQQLADFERMCAVNEALLTSTLMKRFDIPDTDANFELVKGWLSSARSMGVASHILSGIKAEFVEP